jgi:hypothetical protein
MFAPSTFDSFHCGEDETWTSAGGAWHRIDFVGLPCAWREGMDTSWIERSIELGTDREDHWPACVRVALEPAQGTKRKQLRKLEYDRSFGEEKDEAARALDWAKNSFEGSWYNSVHDHAHKMAEALNSAFQLASPAKTNKEGKTVIHQ